jgi:hypothetical protein
VGHYDSPMGNTEDPWTPTDERRLESFASHYIIMATCACGHAREIHVQMLLRRVGTSVTIGRLRDCQRCHQCQARRPGIEVRRIPR